MEAKRFVCQGKYPMHTKSSMHVIGATMLESAPIAQHV